MLARRVMLALTILLVFTLNAFGSQAHSFTISKVQGPKYVSVTRKNKKASLKTGDAVLAGDLVQTSKEQLVELQSEDDARIVISENSELKITDDPNATQALQLMSGKLLGWTNPVNKNKPSTSKKYRFLIQTRTAVMGVRGTKFAVDTSQKTTFRVLEGVVDIATDIKSLLTENIVVVKAGELVSVAEDGVGTVAQGTKGVVVAATDTIDSGVRQLSAAMPFDVLGFVAEMNKKLPPEFHVPVLTASAPREPASEPSSEPTSQPSRFHISSLELFWQAHEPSIGFGLSWNPTFHLVPDQWDLRAHVGSSHLFEKGQGFFGNLELKLMGAYIIKQAAYLELGPILWRRFTNDSFAYGVGGNGGIWFGDKRVLHLLDRIFFGVNHLRTSTGSLWEIRFGLGFTVFE